MNRGRLHTGKEGSGTLGGKAGRSRDATPGTGTVFRFSVITWLLSLSPVSLSMFLLFHHTVSSPSLVIPFLDNTTGAQHPHDNRIKACMWCLSSIHSLTGGRWHVHAAWRLLGHGREC